MKKDRLLKLAGHLENGQLSVDKFNFGVYYQIVDCGTEGCAIGECPFIWPLHWHFINNYPRLIKEGQKDAGNVTLDVAAFFEIPPTDADKLFAPGIFQGLTKNRLCTRVSKERLVARIRYFVEHGTLEGSITEEEILASRRP